MSDDSTEKCAVVLWDRSRSMGALTTAGDGDPVADAFRDFLAVLAEEQLDCAVAVLGYGTNRRAQPYVTPADLGVSPRADGFVDARSLPEEGIAIRWQDAWSSGGTPTSAAFEKCYELLAPWVQRRPQSARPMVLHVTDGQPRDGSPLAAAQRLRELATEDGPVQLMNFVLAEEDATGVLFPASADFAGGTSHDRQARLFFELSSPLDDDARESAGLVVSPQPPTGARALAFRGNPTQLLNFLEFAASVVIEA